MQDAFAAFYDQSIFLDFCDWGSGGDSIVGRMQWLANRLISWICRHCYTVGYGRLRSGYGSIRQWTWPFALNYTAVPRPDLMRNRSEDTAVYDTAIYGRNTVHTKTLNYCAFTAVIS